MSAADRRCLNWIQQTVVHLPYGMKKNRHMAPTNKGMIVFQKKKKLSEGALAESELHLSCWIQQLTFESEHRPTDLRPSPGLTSIHNKTSQSLL